MLEPDHNQVYDLSSICEGVFVRTGVIADGSCFYHAYLRVFRPTYKRANTTERARIVSQLRRALAAAVSETTLNAELYLMLFTLQLRKFVAESKFGGTEHGEVLAQLVDVDKIIDECSSFTGNLFVEFVNKINAAGRAASGSEELYNSKLVPYVEQWARSLFSRTNQVVVKEFKERLLNDYVGCPEMEYISRCLKCNFLFVKEGKIYPFKVIIDSKWPFLVMNWVSEMHFELIGQLGADRVIKRKFDEEDSFVRAFLK